MGQRLSMEPTGATKTSRTEDFSWRQKPSSPGFPLCTASYRSTVEAAPSAPLVSVFPVGAAADASRVSNLAARRNSYVPDCAPDQFLKDASTGNLVVTSSRFQASVQPVPRRPRRAPARRFELPGEIDAAPPPKTFKSMSPSPQERLLSNGRMLAASPALPTSVLLRSIYQP